MIICNYSEITKTELNELKNINNVHGKILHDHIDNTELNNFLKVMIIV